MQRYKSGPLLVIQTGGTIDKGYPKAVGGYAFEIGDSAVERILDNKLVNFKVEYVSVCRKDSQDINDTDREMLLTTCQSRPEEKVLISHGTDTMIQTAQYLGERLASPGDKRIVLTGAQKPEVFKDTDAEFNVGVALGALQSRPSPGVYLAMNGSLHHWTHVHRDTTTGEFNSDI